MCFLGMMEQCWGNYIRQRHQARNLQVPATQQELVIAVEDVYLSSPLDELVALELPQTDRDRRVHNAAIKFLGEMKAVAWVEKQNYDNGVAPSSASVAAQFAQACSTLGAQHVGERVSRQGRRLRKWAANLRARWGLRFGVVKPREEVPPGEIAQKAGFVLSVFVAVRQILCPAASYGCGRGAGGGGGEAEGNSSGGGGAGG